MVDAIVEQNDLLKKVEKGLRQRNAPKRVERDEKGRPIRVVPEPVAGEEAPVPQDRMADLLQQVAGTMGEAPGPMNITRSNGRLGVE